MEDEVQSRDAVPTMSQIQSPVIQVQSPEKSDIVEALDSLPHEMLSYPLGFALDIGGSATKLIYRDKQKRSGLLLTSFPRDDIDTLVTFILDHVDMTSSDGATCVVTGVGIKKYGTHLEKKLGVKLKLVPEFDCAVKSFQYFSKHLPRDEFFAPLSRTAFEGAYESAMEWAKGFSQLPEMAESSDHELDFMVANEFPSCDVMYAGYGQGDDMFPCIIVTCGSGFAAQALHEDGKMDMLDYSNRAGRMFLGLGNLLTGAKTYDELTELASRGDSKNVHSLIRDLHDGSGVDFYSMMPRDLTVFAFGKAMGTDRANFTKEDIAAALLDVICGDLCQFIILMAKIKNIPRVYFIGSFVNHDIVRESLTRAFLERANMFIKEMNLVMRIIPLGSYFTAIGSWIQGWEEYQKTNQQ